MKPHIDELLVLKDTYQELNDGVPFVPPKDNSKKKKKKKNNQENEAKKEGEEGDGEGDESKMSNKKLKREKRKEAKRKALEEKQNQEAKDASSQQQDVVEESKSSSLPTPPLPTQSVEFSGEKGKFIYSKGNAILSLKLVSCFDFSPILDLEENSSLSSPLLLIPPSWDEGSSSSSSVCGDLSISLGLVLYHMSGSPSLFTTPTQTLFFLERALELITNPASASDTLQLLDTHFTYHTYMVNHQPSPLDALFHSLLSSHSDSFSPQVSRWSRHIAKLDILHITLLEDDEGSHPGCPPLEGAVMGEVMTRFPPEPSGFYLLLLCLNFDMKTTTRVSACGPRQSPLAQPTLCQEV